MPSYRVDTSRPPLLRVHFDGVVDDDAFQRYIDELKAWVDRGERYAMLVVRGALIAMLWVQPLPFPHKVVADVAAADAWCLQQLNGAGPPL